MFTGKEAELFIVRRSKVLCGLKTPRYSRNFGFGARRRERERLCNLNK
jgi:hypothetical protein